MHKPIRSQTREGAMTEDPSNFEDANPEPLSTLEALDDIADIAENIVLSFGGDQEQDAYLTLAEEHASYADTLPEEPARRTPQQNGRLQELEKQMEDAFGPILRACPDHIRKLHDAVRAAIGAEEASRT
jgi:hypothetical protein